MSKYTKNQLHEAYSVEYFAHKETQKMLNQEIRAHADTRRRLLELQDFKFGIEQIIEIDDSWLNIIFDCMQEYGDDYTNEDFDIYKSLKHYNIGGFFKGRLVAFGCVLEYEGARAVCYSWNNGTITGKKLYTKGIDFITTMFDDVVFEDYGSRLNKVKRIKQWHQQ